ncbi:MAG: biopolymer transporter ExbD [Planctomycetaceae bacterium]|nr:biopolymer transporter ExbD [Planctomycetaceae bacterium]
MARAKRKVESASIDLTPMIDVVFQLIIFFILTMQISQADLKNVQLPTAITALIPSPEEGVTLHIYNDSKDATDITKMPDINAWHVTWPKSKEKYTKVDQLFPRIDEKARLYDAEHGGPNEMGNSNMEVIVRGDMRAPSHFFAVILGACQKAKVFKVKISIKPRLDQQD